MVIRGIKENLTNALGAVGAAQAAQSELDTIVANIQSAVVLFDTGIAREEIANVIQGQIDAARDVIRNTSFNGINLLEKRNIETLVSSYQRDPSGLKFSTTSLIGLGLDEDIEVGGLAPAVPPPAGALLQLDAGGGGDLQDTNATNTPNVNGVNTGNSLGRTIALSFETGADENTTQILYAHGTGARGISIAIQNGELIFGGWSNAGTNWRVFGTTPIQANARYTTTLVYDGTVGNTGTLTGYVNGNEAVVINGAGREPNGGNVGIGVNEGGSIRVANAITAGPNPFQGSIERVLGYGSALSGATLDELNAHLQGEYLSTGGVQGFGSNGFSTDNIENASFVDLIEALAPTGQSDYTTRVALEVVDAARQRLNFGFSQLGAYEDTLRTQQDFLGDVADSMDLGIAALIEADLDEESTRLAAQLVQADLAARGLGLTNARSNLVLELFR